MTPLDILRLANTVAWGLVALYMASGAYVATRGKDVRRGDPMRLACFATALLFVGFNARWLLAPDDQTVWVVLYILSLADAAFIWRLGVAYGRGPRV